MRVQYSATPAKISSNQVITWQVGYVLAPARRWASFGTLNVLAQLPPDWLFASDPPLQRTGDEARGTFTGVPADSVALTAPYPFRSTGPLDRAPFWVTVAAVAVLGLLIAFAGGTLAGRRGSSGSGLLPLSLVYGVLGGIGLLFIGALAPADGPPLPGFQAGSSYASLGAGLVNIVFLFGVSFLFAVVLTIVMQIVAGLAARRSRRPRPA